jgi:hypothetical protein
VPSGLKPIIVTQLLSSYRIRDGKVWGKLREDGTVDISAYASLSSISVTKMATCKKAGAICIDLANPLFSLMGVIMKECRQPRVGQKTLASTYIKNWGKSFNRTERNTK